MSPPLVTTLGFCYRCQAQANVRLIWPSYVSSAWVCYACKPQTEDEGLTNAQVQKDLDEEEEGAFR